MKFLKSYGLWLFLIAWLLRLAYMIFYQKVAAPGLVCPDTLVYKNIADLMLGDPSNIGNGRFLERLLFPLFWALLMVLFGKSSLVTGPEPWLTGSLLCLLSAATVIFVYKTALEIFERKRHALLAALFVVFSPIQLFYGHTLLTEPIGCFTFAGFFWAFIKALKTDGWKYRWVTALFVALSILTRPSMVFIDLLLALAFLLPGRFQRRKLFARFLPSAILSILALGLILFWVDHHIQGRMVENSVSKKEDQDWSRWNAYQANAPAYYPWDNAWELRTDQDSDPSDGTNWFLQPVQPAASGWTAFDLQQRALRCFKGLVVYWSPSLYGFKHTLWYKGAFAYYLAALLLTFAGFFYLRKYPLLYFAALTWILFGLLHANCYLAGYGRGRIHLEIVQALLLAPPLAALIGKWFPEKDEAPGQPPENQR